jgi:agmatinase
MKSKQEKIDSFNPNDSALSENNIFGLPFNREESEVIILPLPWEVTVSYHAGTAEGPAAVFGASGQVDLYDPLVEDAWKIGVYMPTINEDWRTKGQELRSLSVRLIALLNSGVNEKEILKLDYLQKEINLGCEKFKKEVKIAASEILASGKLLIGLGGDHSTPLGIMEALAEHHGEFGILQFDAHADLRNSFEGFTYSHASIMYNALKIKEVTKLVQVGIRDYCQEEVDLIQSSKGRIYTKFDRDIKQDLYRGKTRKEIFIEVIAQLPGKIYVSFDIDALDPKLCPHTGTPVAGGFDTEEILYFLELVLESGKNIIAMDLNEVGHNEWDANVGARLLYRLCNILALSNGRAKKIG